MAVFVLIKKAQGAEHKGMIAHSFYFADLEYWSDGVDGILLEPQHSIIPLLFMTLSTIKIN
jgi:hypothetical protein